MALYNPNVQLEILKAIMAENTFEAPLTPDNVVLSNFVHGAGGASTCVVDGKRYSGLKSFRQVAYHRISIVELFKNIKMIVEAPECKTTKDLLPTLEANYGISLTADEIVDHPISWFDPDQDYVYECELEIKANHPIYYGKIKVSVSGILLDIEKILTKVEVDSIVDTGPHVAGKQNVTMTTYGVDYSAHAEWFKDNIAQRMAPGGYDSIPEAKAKELASRLSSMDGLPWTYGTNTKEFNLNGATIAAHLSTVDFRKYFPAPFPEPNAEHQRVIVIATSGLDPNNSPVNGWWYFIHYNVVGRID